MDDVSKVILLPKHASPLPLRGLNEVTSIGRRGLRDPNTMAWHARQHHLKNSWANLTTTLRHNLLGRGHPSTNVSNFTK